MSSLFRISGEGGGGIPPPTKIGLLNKKYIRKIVEVTQNLLAKINLSKYTCTHSDIFYLIGQEKI